MTSVGQDTDGDALSHYAAALADLVAERAGRFLRNSDDLTPDERWHKALTNAKSVEKLVDDLPDAGRLALAVFRTSPSLERRWDHAVRLVQACGVEFPYAVLQGLLGDGLLVMRRASLDPLTRFDVPEGSPPEGLPFVRLSPPLADRELKSLPKVVEPIAGRTPSSGWRSTDGWEMPLRLAVLWRLAWRSPIKRTQQNVLFKRDQERVAAGPLLTGSPPDAPAPLLDAGMLTYNMAMALGWLRSTAEEQRPEAPLIQLWQSSLLSLQAACAKAMLSIEGWNELGSAAPAGSLSREVVSARYLLLLWLSTLPEGEGVAPEELGDRLLEAHPPWNAKGEVYGPFRQKDQRIRLARDWARAALLGVFYQCGIVEVADGVKPELLVRLSPLGRMLTGGPPPAEPPPPPEQTLLAQPNHQMIVYRQGLTLPLLAKLASFAEPTGLGPALMFEINADSVYLGFESGLDEAQMISLLQTHGGREPPTGVTESIRTWAQKRGRMSVYSNVSLFEFDSAQDLAAAVSRGLEGVQVSERLLLVAGEPSFGNLRITAQRDYVRSPAEPCATPQEDGVGLQVDLARSDLMLESELTRFSDPAESGGGAARQHYRVTPASIKRALDRGMNQDLVVDWYRRRTGAPPPPAVMLLLHLAEGATIPGRSLIVLELPDAGLADGLMQHPSTAELFAGRLGPTALAAPMENLAAIREACRSLGGRFSLDGDVGESS